jgi:hypothetical protein
VIRRGAIGLWALAALLVALSASSAPAYAQSASPSPSKGPSVNGEISGSLVRGATLSIRVDATMPGGWQGLHLIDVVVRSGSQTLEELAYDIEDDKLTIAGQSVITGTGSVGTGEYLRVSGADVILTTGGGNLSLQINADVIKTIPDGARFDLRVIGDTGETARARLALAEPQSTSGFGWGTLVAFVAVALFAGGFVGNLFANKRRPRPRMSVYGAVQRKLDEERAAEGEPPAAGSASPVAGRRSSSS